MTHLKRNLIIHLIISMSLYLLFAFLDIHFTLKGMNGDISLEGNPIMRFMMDNFGLIGGLAVEKTLVLLVALTVAIVAFLGIEKESDWVFYLALTPLTRNWMKRRKRYGVAFVPIYFVALSQGVAAAGWAHLIAEYGVF